MERYKTMDVKRMNQKQKAQRYQWRVNGLMKCIDHWADNVRQPERDGVFDLWPLSELRGEGLTDLMVEMAELASEVDPQSVELWVKMRRDIINIRIKSYQIMKSIHEGFDRPVPTPEEEAAAEAERIEAYRTGGGSLVSEPAAPNSQGGQPDGPGDPCA